MLRKNVSGYVVNYDGIYSTIRKVEINEERKEFHGDFLHSSFAAAKNELVKHLTHRRDDYRWALKEVRSFTAKDLKVEVPCIAYRSDFCQCGNCGSAQ